MCVSTARGVLDNTCAVGVSPSNQTPYEVLYAPSPPVNRVSRVFELMQPPSKPRATLQGWNLESEIDKNEIMFCLYETGVVFCPSKNKKGLRYCYTVAHDSIQKKLKTTCSNVEYVPFNWNLKKSKTDALKILSFN